MIKISPYQIARLLKKNEIPYDWNGISNIIYSRHNGRPFVFFDCKSQGHKAKIKTLLKSEGVDFVEPIQPLTLTIYMDKIPKSGRP